MPSYLCRTCGGPVSGPESSSNCPRCLLKMGIDEPTIAQDLQRFDLPTPQQLDRAIPRLDVIDLIAHGGMGAVYRARQPELDRIVAIKVLPAELSRNHVFAERFAQEARTLAKLNHPNIVTIHDSGIASGWCYIVMEHVEGITLRDAISQKSISPEHALDMVPELCDALKAAHRQGIIHRDIKPENILLSRDGFAKIADFGIAKLLSNVGESEFNAGTRRYMAPEQMVGNPDIDHRADIYSLGVVLYELLTGKVPGEEFIPPSKTAGIDQRLDLVIRKTLERRPELRYQDVKEIAEEFERLRSVEYPNKIYKQIMLANQGIEWKSRAKIFGVPVVHIATGMDLETGRKRIAKGWFAFGDIAVGGFAVGGLGVGLVGMGGLGAGLVGIGGAGIGLLLGTGGFATGLVANGGGAIGGIAQGGGASGAIAIGGGAAGHVAIGGGATGNYVLAGTGISPEGWLTNTSIGSFMTETLPWLLPTLPPIIYLLVLIPVLLTGMLSLASQRHPKHGELLDGENAQPAPLRYLIGMGAAMLGGGLAITFFGFQLSSVFASILETTQSRLVRTFISAPRFTTPVTPFAIRGRRRRGKKIWKDQTRLHRVPCCVVPDHAKDPCSHN